MMVTGSVEESGMTFGPYPNRNCYHIEKFVKDSLKPNHGMKIVEFIVVHNEKLCLIEAKTTQPNPKSSKDHEDSIEDIRQKFFNALMLCIAAGAGRMPKMRKECEPMLNGVATADFRMVLIIKKCQEDWVLGIRESLLKLFNSSAFIGMFRSVGLLPDQALIVYNEDQARGKGLIR